MTSKIPLVRLSTTNPVLLELRNRDADAAGLLRSLGLPEDVPASPELFVSADSVYALVERAAEIVGDPYLGYDVGKSLELANWEVVAPAAETARNVGELLTNIAIHSIEHASSVEFFLTVRGERTTFGFDRTFTTPISPAQIDALYQGLISRILTRATRDHWDASKVLFHVADPGCVRNEDRALRIAKGDGRGIKVSFPTEWLLAPFEKSTMLSNPTERPFARAPKSLVDSLRAALRPHLHEPDLTVDKAARICGNDRRKLSRQLRDDGTTISKEIAKLRAERAGRDLAETDQRIAEIAQKVGFTDPTVFSRAFKNWTGQSPQQYRRTHRSPG